MGADAPKGAKISSVILFFQGTLYLCVMFIPLFLTVPVLTSARRWLRLGVWRTWTINQVVVFAYYLGIAPRVLARLYQKKY